MSNITVLGEIIEVLESYLLDDDVKNIYIRCAFQATLIKYKKQLSDEYNKNALDVVEHKIEHLVRKLK